LVLLEVEYYYLADLVIFCACLDKSYFSGSELLSLHKMSYRVPFNAEPQDDSGSSSGEEDRLSDWASSLGEALQTKSLFSDRTFPNPTAAIEFDTKEHGFSIKDESTKKGLDLYGRMRLINWIRKEVRHSNRINKKSKLMNRELVLRQLNRWMAVIKSLAMRDY